MSEYAEFVIDDTGTKVRVDDTGAKVYVEPPYIRYTPWEPTPGADLHTLAVKVAELERLMLKTAAEMAEATANDILDARRDLTAAVADLQQRLARLEGMTLQHSREL